MGKRSLADEPTFFPVPAALLTFRSGTGRPRFVAANWLGMTCNRPVVVSAAFRAAENAHELRSGGAFAVNLLPEEMLVQPGFRRALVAAAGDLGAVAGLSLCEGAVTEAPLIAECAVCIECRRGGVRTLFHQDLIRGEIVAVHLDGIRYGRDEAVDFCRLNPLASSSGPFPLQRSNGLPG